MAKTQTKLLKCSTNIKMKMEYIQIINKKPIIVSIWLSMILIGVYLNFYQGI